MATAYRFTDVYGYTGLWEDMSSGTPAPVVSSVATAVGGGANFHFLSQRHLILNHKRKDKRAEEAAKSEEMPAETQVPAASVAETGPEAIAQAPIARDPADVVAEIIAKHAPAVVSVPAEAPEADAVLAEVLAQGKIEVQQLALGVIEAHSLAKAEEMQAAEAEAAARAAWIAHLQHEDEMVLRFIAAEEMSYADV